MVADPDARFGLSPRVRGNHDGTHAYAYFTGSIPAYAGEPRHQRQRQKRRRVYPRVCGGTPVTALVVPSANGLSPRMRGNPACSITIKGRARSIPAYAGGTPSARNWAISTCGLSPRMRGNLFGEMDEGVIGGSIPAYAGEPAACAAASRAIVVYPRVCGGTRNRNRTSGGVLGLSPRMRGNR